MAMWRRLVGAVGAILTGGALVNGAATVLDGAAPGAALIDILLVGGPGLALIYGAWKLPDAGIDDDLHDRIAAWCFGIMTVMAVVVVLASLRPGAVFARPVATALTSAALGGAAGLTIGMFEGRAVTRSREQARVRAEAEEIRRRNEELEGIQSVIAHDVKSPLSGVYGNIDLARDTGDLAHLDDAEEATRRVESLVEDIGQMAREGVTVRDTETIRVDEVARDVWRSLDTPKARLDLELDEFEVEGDPHRVERLLDNLFRNALVHAGPDVAVRVGPLAEEEGFYVEDDGPGLPTDDPEKVLQVGYTTHDEGTGFGLSIVDRIARSHGWEMSFGDGPSGGARIEVRT